MAEEKQIAVQENYELSMFNARGLESLMKLSSQLAASDIIPDTFKKKPANVLIALNMAQRMNADPFAIMQNMYIVYGNPAFSSKFLISCFNSCGRFTSIKYQFTGTEGADDWGCTAYATEKATGDKVVGTTVTIGMAKKEGWYGKSGSKWQTMPQLMLQYRAAAFLIRTTAPEIMMGMEAADELEDIGGRPKYVGNNFDDDQAEMNAEVAKELEAPKMVDFTDDAKTEVPQKALQPEPAPVAKPVEKEAPQAVKKAQPSWVK